jgi:Alpha galactosidase A
LPPFEEYKMLLLFIEWTVDYVKLDGCYSEPSTMITGYPEFGRYNFLMLKYEGNGTPSTLHGR